MGDLPILTAPLRTMIPIIKVVGDFCNLRCPYCFYHLRDQSTQQVMSIELLETFISQYMQLFSGHITFNWHGGEPLLAGLPFFQNVVEFQQANLRKGHSIRNTIQTNATLITDEWACFIKEHDFGVGVSLDGDKLSHNRFRINCAGRGSFDDVIRGIETLRRHEVEPGVIQTITHSTVDRARENFDFLARVLGFKHWGVNIYADPRGMNPAMHGEAVCNEELTNFLKTYIDLWLEQDDPNLRIRELDNFIFGIVDRKTTACNFNGSCTGFFCLDYDGNVYPCDRLSNRPDLAFGDITQQPLIDILNGSKRLSFAEAVNAVHSDCVFCNWQKACHNGCTMHRQGGLQGKYLYCEARQVILTFLKEKVAQYPLVVQQ